MTEAAPGASSRPGREHATQLSGSGGAVASGDAEDIAQQIWSSIHGAVALELNRIVKTPDPGATYERLLGLLVAGPATPR
jgi:hypothetical protein